MCMISEPKCPQFSKNVRMCGLQLFPALILWGLGRSKYDCSIAILAGGPYKELSLAKVYISSLTGFLSSEVQICGYAKI